MRIIILSLLACLMISCKSELTHETALAELAAQSEFQTPFYAPMHFGREILSGDDHKNPQAYLSGHLGKLIESGLVEAKIAESNSWRSVLVISLTEQGRLLSDPSRSDDEQIYVQVCRVTPTKIDSLRVITPDEEVEVSYTFTESEVTPFGEHMEFSNGRTHRDSRLFRRSGGSWVID